jgi:hypothetical protein
MRFPCSIPVFLVVVRFKKTIRIRARLSAVPQPVETPTRFSGRGGEPAAEADSLVSAWAASLKRSPAANLSSNCTLLHSCCDA